METKVLLKTWFDKWEKGDFLNLPISEDFTHLSPFGIIEGKKTYLNTVEKNKDKFLGNVFKIHDVIYESNKVCVRYTAKQEGVSFVAYGTLMGNPETSYSGDFKMTFSDNKRTLKYAQYEDGH